MGRGKMSVQAAVRNVLSKQPRVGVQETGKGWGTVNRQRSDTRLFKIQVHK